LYQNTGQQKELFEPQSHEGHEDNDTNLCDLCAFVVGNDLFRI
jgi:hypothetical protein